MADATEFRHQVQQMGKLVSEFEQMPDGPLKVSAGELIHLLTEMHSTAIERMMEIVFESRESGPSIIDKLGSDPIVSSLLLLYSLHPEDVQTRVQRALDALRPRLRKLNCSVVPLTIEADTVRLQIDTSSHACGSTVEGLRSTIEEGIYDYAPDVASLVILSPDEKPSSGFVSLESLAHTSAAALHPLAAGGAD